MKTIYKFLKDITLEQVLELESKVNHDVFLYETTLLDGDSILVDLSQFVKENKEIPEKFKNIKFQIDVSDSETEGKYLWAQIVD